MGAIALEHTDVIYDLQVLTELIMIHLVLIIDFCPCLQQPLNCCNMSIVSSYPERNTAMLQERNEFHIFNIIVVY